MAGYKYCGNCGHRKKEHGWKGCRKCRQNKTTCPKYVEKEYKG